MEAKDKSILQQIQERYPGIDPDIDIDWEVGEIFFNTGEKQGIDKGRKEVVELLGEEPFEHNYSIGIAEREHLTDDCFACRWEAKLKEWGIEH